ncbi:transposase [Streptomyces sp. NPDC048445]|uniref:transposase n=1 Tax=Streptomyces sp. NPDC048445 TaxID=3365553 RepID=UPI00371B9735
MSGIAVMRQAALVLGHPASASTLYRALDAIGPVELAKIASARAKARSRVHDLLDLRPGGFPWIRVDGRALTGWTVLDIDASLVPAHSDKEGAEPNRKGYGLHPILLFLDNTDEHLVCRLRPGSAGANTASDHIEVCAQGLRQLPTRRRRKVLFRADGAGATREYLRWITDGGGNKANTWQYSVGWTREEDFWTQLAKVPATAWSTALDAKGKPREDAALVEITGMLDLTGWPEGLRIVVRREPVHPKYAKDLKPYEVATGFRYQAIATNTPGRQLQWLDACHRVHAHVESGIRRSKALTLTRLPSAKFALNQAWCTLLAIAMDLLSWFQLLALDGRLARAGHHTRRTVRHPGQAHRPRPPPRTELRPSLARRPHHGQSLEPRPGPARPRLTPTPPTQHAEGALAAPSARGSRRPPRRYRDQPPCPRPEHARDERALSGHSTEPLHVGART